ncbi:MAG TPA: outer membrane protein assembly factor BamA [Nitrospiraceae bacterium]|nr:outer membrane protein assembly factor BamA [Nitrospiraceae bacterium]HBU05943.1 outer membrane protein assembly factor BamA [Nitrospiraceae bacterium]
MRKSSLLFFWFIILAVFIGGTESVSAQEISLPLVNSMEVRGLKRIEEAAVKSKITQKTGEPLSSEKTTNDIKDIYKMGYFDDVQVEIEPLEGGVRVIYLIKEKPTIISIDFQGNKKQEDSDLKEKITITANSIADTVLIQDNAEKLRAFYEEEGYYLSKIVPVVNKVNDDEVTLTYQIEEGPKVKIKSIVIEGNKVISKKEIKKAIQTSEWWLFSFFTSSGYYKKDEMNFDIERIKNLYFNKGYIKVAVSDPKIQLTEDKKGMIISIMISEGEQFSISSVNITGNKAFTEAELRKKIKSAPKNVFSRAMLRSDVAALGETYAEKGYALVNVGPDIEPDAAARQVKITFKIDEGGIYKIGRIDISGNIKTMDKVIRREIRLDEGDTFNSKLLKRSYERLNNLNFFEAVDLQPKPKPEEKLLDIDVKVKEKPTGMLSVGGGYSSVDKFIATADVTQANLFGTGRLIKLKGEFGGRSTAYSLGYRDPWFLDKELLFGTDIYKTTRKYSAFDRKASGFDVLLGKSLSEYWKTDVTYNLENVTIHNISPNASGSIKDQEGKKITSSITPAIVRDSRNSFLDPHTGSKNLLYVTYAGLGGDNFFIKGGVDSSWFFPATEETTLAFRGRYGQATGIFNKPLPLYERFYVGGIYTVRGIGFGEGGPRDANGEVIGGTKQLIFNTEYIFPLVSELKLKGVTFFDAGRAFDSFKDFGDFKYGAGIGFRWFSPIGPIRLEWGHNLNPKTGESKSKWEFTFGTAF